VEDIDEIFDSARHFALTEACGPLMLNRISVLSASKRHLKAALKERIQTLVAAYISLGTFVEDEEAFKAADDSKKSKRMFKRVLRNIEQNDEEIRAFLKGLAANPDALDS
jgi:transcription termination factor NusB